MQRGIGQMGLIVSLSLFTCGRKPTGHGETPVVVVVVGGGRRGNNFSKMGHTPF